jgi:hypothetical protein
MHLSFLYLQARHLKRDPTDEEVKIAMDAEVASILKKKDVKRDNGKMLVGNSSDDDFLEERLDNLEEFKSWSTKKMSSIETMLKALYDDKFPAKITKDAKARSGSVSSSSEEQETSLYEVLAVDMDAQKSIETSPSRSHLPIPVSSNFQVVIV